MAIYACGDLQKISSNNNKNMNMFFCFSSSTHKPIIDSIQRSNAHHIQHKFTLKNQYWMRRNKEVLFLLRLSMRVLDQKEKKNLRVFEQIFVMRKSFISITKASDLSNYFFQWATKRVHLVKRIKSNYAFGDWENLRFYFVLSCSSFLNYSNA